MQGYNVLYPMGWDAFGLPAENYAIKTGQHPAISTAENISNIKRQINEIAAIYDWDMEVNTTDPEFYKWTQLDFRKDVQRKALHTRNRCQSTGVHHVRQDLRTKK